MSELKALTDSRSDFVRVRGLRYHVRRWGDASARRIFLFHGWLDVSATFEPLVQELLRLTEGGWQVLAPDWRGFGFSEWPQDGYWFYDYIADMEELLDHYSPEDAAVVLSHSMGSQVASLYAGLRPARVSQLVCLDSLFMPDMKADLAAPRLRKWLDQLRKTPVQKSYVSFDDLARRVHRMHPRLTADRARFVAQCWGRADGQGRITLCADPKHQISGPGLYHTDESEAVWREVTAQTLFIDAGKSDFRRSISVEENTRRRACFRNRSEHLIEEAGHMLHFDAPEATARLIADFLAQPAVTLAHATQSAAAANRA